MNELVLILFFSYVLLCSAFVRFGIGPYNFFPIDFFQINIFLKEALWYGHMDTKPKNPNKDPLLYLTI